MDEATFVLEYSVQSVDRTRYTNADARKSAAYDVPFYPKTDSWKPGFVFAPFGAGVPWLTAHDAGSSHPGQRPCLHYNLADTASRLRSKASKPVFCKLPNLFLSAAELGTNPRYVEAVVFYGFSRFTEGDWRDAAMDGKKAEKGFSLQQEGGKVKCKILMKMSPTGNKAFAWYDLTDTKAASQPRSFSDAVANAKWKVLNTNAGYFMGNEKSAVLFTPGTDPKAIEASKDPAKILLATMAKLIGDMSTALASSAWMAQFHPGGDNQISKNWIDAWTGVDVVVGIPRPVNILGESGDRLQVWQGSDRNGATLYTGSRQDANKLQTATFIPSRVDPDRLLNYIKAGIAVFHATLDNQYSTLLAEVNTYIDNNRERGHEGLFADTAYVGVKETNRPYVKEQLGIYLSYVHEQINSAYNQARAPGGILDRSRPDGDYAGLSANDIKNLRDELSLHIVDLMPQKTSLFIKEPTCDRDGHCTGGKLHKVFQIKKGVALLPSPSDAITKINTTARYKTQRGGATTNDALDAFAIALRISMPPNPEDPMFLQFAKMIPPDPAAPVADPLELDDGASPPRIDFRALFVLPGPAAIQRAGQILNAIHEPMLLHEKWYVMDDMWGSHEPIDPGADEELWNEIINSYQIAQDAEENLKSDDENVRSIIDAPSGIETTPATMDTIADRDFIYSHFVPYGVGELGGGLPEQFSSDIAGAGTRMSSASAAAAAADEGEDASSAMAADRGSAAAAAAPYPHRGFLAQPHVSLGMSGRSNTGGPSSSSSSSSAALLGKAVLEARERRRSLPGLSGTKRRLSKTGLNTFADLAPAPAPAPGAEEAAVVMNSSASSSSASASSSSALGKGGRKTYRRRRLPKLL